MSLGIAARIARREMRGGLAGFRVFLACLALGVAAIAAVGSVRESIKAGIAAEGAVLLGGDAQITLTYQRADAEARAWMDTAGAVSEVVAFRSMAVAGEGDGTLRALTEVKAVDGAYPLYGAVELDPPQPLDAALAAGGAVMDPLLAEQLKIAPGDSFRLGDRSYRLSALITREPDNAGGFSLGPRTLLGLASIEGTGLVRPGTLFDSEYRIKVPAGTDLAALERAALSALEGLGPRWRDARDGAPGMRRFVDRMGAFLVLVGLAGLAVGGVGISSAVRAYIDGKTATIATLKTLGAQGRTIFQVYFLQIGALTMLGLAAGLVLGAALPVAFAPVIASFLSLPADLAIYPRPLAEAALYGVLAALLFTLWPLSRAGDLRAAALFRDAGLGGARGWPRLRYVTATGIVMALFIAAAAWLSGVAVLALWAAFGVFAAFLVLVAAGWGIRALSRFLARRRAVQGRPALRMALGAVGGPGGDAVSVVLSLGLGLSVLAAVGQIDNNLRGAIARDLPDVAPSFFVVDIQPDQIGVLLARLENDPGVRRTDQAPMLRGVITRIGGRPAIEVAGDHWVVRGDRGLTYAAEKPERTTLTEGAWWPADYAGPPQMSFAAEEAAEIGLKLGDTITINVLGREITATITSFRTVDFSSAGMGFVMSMNPAALAGAPHSFIATIYAARASEAAILRDLSRDFPNVTTIGVRDAIARVVDLLGSISAAITYGALATLVTGGVVLIGAAAAGERARAYEAALLKTLGATRATILWSFALRQVILGSAAGLVAVFAGAVAGWAVTVFVMENAYAFEPVSAALIVLGGIAMTTLAGLAFALRPLAARPAQTLRARE